MPPVSLPPATHRCVWPIGSGAWSPCSRAAQGPDVLRFIIRYLVVALLVAVSVLTLAFLLTRLSGDLAISITGANANQADVNLIRKAYGLDRPLWIQCFASVGNAVTGDFGDSYFFKQCVAALIGARLPITLGLVGLAIALVVSIPPGVLAAVRENTAFDRAVQVVALLGQAMPSFWLALILPYRGSVRSTRR